MAKTFKVGDFIVPNQIYDYCRLPVMRDKRMNGLIIEAVSSSEDSPFKQGFKVLWQSGEMSTTSRNFIHMWFDVVKCKA